MVRLSKKILSNIKDLPGGWTTRNEFVITLLSDDLFVFNVQQYDKSISKSPDMISNVTSIMFGKHGWQLTKWGCQVLQRSYNCYDIYNEKDPYVTGKMIINLDKIVKSPWHFAKNKFLVWDQGIYFEIKLFDDDIKRFVDFYVPKN